MHGIFEELFVILAYVPFILLHQLTVFVETVRIVILRIPFKEFTAFTLRLFNNFRSEFTRQTSGFTQNHIPNIVGNHSPALFAFLHRHHVHHGQILHILTEWCNQRRITDTRPYVSHFIKQLNKKLILCHKRQITFCLVFIDRFKIGFKVSHQTPHHTARQSGSNQ